MPNRAAILKQQFSQSIGLPRQDILPEGRLEAILAEEAITYRNCLYTPIVTLWAMIFQVLNPDKSLSHVVKQMTTWLSLVGAACPSADTGAYSKARTRLPESLLQRLVPETSAQLEQQVPASQQWCSRRVRVCDGTTVLMSDSAANQAVYPQHGNQATGCGFPIAKLVVIFSLLTGAVVSACIADWHTSEIVLSRQLYADLDPDDVLVADQAYGSYMDLALVQQQQADGVFRKHHARHTDFRRGHKSGIGDHQVTWQKPKKCPEHMTEAEFKAVPETLLVREVCLRLSRRGWRDEPIIVVTTLLDAERYSLQQLTQLYGWRWAAAEVNLRHLKTTLKLEMLTAKTPEMVRKDLWAHLLAYNLLRTVMEQAASQAQYQRAQLSLQGTRQQFNAIIPHLATGDKSMRQRLNQLLLQQIATDLRPLRPLRQEPRVVKRRPKPFPRMKHARSLLKARLVA
ncbi:MAG: IS4 family transposase [Synechococcales cyanobacterium RU_4_20]|nr:IS4 family transposase [Synechococcales cyanobacterium RU_4_20]NJR70580.1 IS4 family transposase [Synechococcales cyanobacterium CRU_2_2]